MRREALPVRRTVPLMSVWRRLFDSLTSRRSPLRSTPRRRPPPPSHRGARRRRVYAPEADGEPDPGEVVWAWVPYEDDPTQGKDRPVLLLAASGDEWLGLMLSSQDHDLDAEDEARYGRLLDGRRRGRVGPRGPAERGAAGPAAAAARRRTSAARERPWSSRASTRSSPRPASTTPSADRRRSSRSQVGARYRGGAARGVGPDDARRSRERAHPCPAPRAARPSA